MIDFDEIIQRLTLILRQHSGRQKILDKEIAESLNLSPQYYAVIKRRKKIPYEALAYISVKNILSISIGFFWRNNLAI